MCKLKLKLYAARYFYVRRNSDLNYLCYFLLMYFVQMVIYYHLFVVELVF